MSQVAMISIPRQAPVEREVGIEMGVMLYLTGLSLRDVESLTGQSRWPLRSALKGRGLLRGRLDFHKPFEARIRNYTVSPTGCWLWQGPTNNMGYGLVSWNGKRMLAHRAMREFVGRPIPDGLDARHKCDVTNCINPDHIEPGTRTDNMQDASERGRTSRGEMSPQSKLTEQIVLEIRRRHAAGEVQRRIADSIGVCYQTVNLVVLRRTWRHVP